MAAIIDSNRGHDAEVRQRNCLGRALSIKDVTAVSAVVLTVRECKRFPTPHTDVGVDPFGRSTAVKHATRYLNLGRKPKALPLQSSIGFTNIENVVAALRRTGPCLYKFQDLLLDVLVRRCGPIGFQQGHQVIHEFFRCHFGEEVRSTIFHTRIRELQCRELYIRISMADSTLQRSHRLSRLNGFRSYQVRNL